MPAYYFDTSALAKRYVVEVGSVWVQAIVTEQSGQMIYTSVLTQSELVSALHPTLTLHRYMIAVQTYKSIGCKTIVEKACM
jgi:hypothetical protein